MEPNLPLATLPPSTALVLLVLCLLGIAFFSSAEASVTSLSKIRLRNLAEKGSPQAEILHGLFLRHERLFATLLTLENFLIIGASTLTTWLVMTLAGPALAPLPFAILAGLTLLLSTTVVVVLGELIPKTLAAHNPERYALAIARPLAGIVALMAPVVWALRSLANLILGAIGFLRRRELPPANPFLTSDELRMLVDVSQEEGVLEREESKMIRSIIELGDTAVREIMRPRIDMVALPEDATFDEAVRVAILDGHSRIPIYRESSDNIIGVLYVKDLLAFLQADERPHQLPTAYVRPAYYIPESKPVDELLEEMRRAKIHLAIVMDEYGGTAGLVTIEDILEEIVGEIQDEYDAEEELSVQHREDGSVLVDGRLSLDEVNELLNVELPTEDYDTLGGFVVGLLGRAPNPGEEVTHGKLRMIAHEVDHRRLVRVQIYRIGTSPLTEDEDAEPEPHARED